VSHISFGNSLTHYSSWPDPLTIISDGAYGIGGFEGDPSTPQELPEWYEDHIKVWSDRSSPQTTLWFWNTEVGWASVHPMLLSHGWVYEQLVTWDKGIGHVAGNVNSKTIRGLPVVTEVCARYTRQPVFYLDGDRLDLQTWLRREWDRTGLPRRDANTACGVKDAATRKYLGTDTQWYPPPQEVFQMLSAYANQHGDPKGAPYFSWDGRMEDHRYKKLRAKWNHQHGLTNVWSHPGVRGSERIRVDGASFHPNQKPLALMQRLIAMSTDPGDVVWEPFGGLCTATLGASRMGRDGYAAEVDPEVHRMAAIRLGHPVPAHENSEEVTILDLLRV
jgi:site-specific DNA-methyltransferase (adenine-specific)